MKTAIIFSILSLPLLEANTTITANKKTFITATEQTAATAQPGIPAGNISAVEFKNQQYCRAELKDFEFDAHFSIVSANVYFSGANFRGVERGAISSSSLQPVKALKDRCIPGSIVVFDDVKVKGPDNTIRTIPGITYRLY